MQEANARPPLQATPAGDQEKCYLSLVIPVYNEQDNLEPLHQKICVTLTDLALPYEVIYVDDGSTDGSLETLRRMAENDPNTTVIQFRRNFGQTAAMSAGIDYSRGDVIGFLDADLQNDPADIPVLLAKMNEGYDLVSGWRKKRKDNWLSRKVPSILANGIISYTMGLRLRDYGCTLKVCRREFLASVRLYGQMHRFIPSYVQLVGGRIAEIPVNHFPRTRGKSKYGLSRTFRVILDLLTVKFLSSFTGSPIYIFGGSGLALIGLSGISGLAMLVHKVLYNISFVQTPLLLLTAFLFVLGFQSILMGLLAELLSRTYHESQGKPTYVVREIIRLPQKGTRSAKGNGEGPDFCSLRQDS